MLYNNESETKYRCASLSTGKTFQGLPLLRETANNSESL
jgi:hypothetical protein